MGNLKSRLDFRIDAKKRFEELEDRLDSVIDRVNIVGIVTFTQLIVFGILITYLLLR